MEGHRPRAPPAWETPLEIPAEVLVLDFLTEGHSRLPQQPAADWRLCRGVSSS